MGNAVAFDSYAYVKKLRDAGLTEQQAAIQAEAIVSLIEERLATKKDLAEVEAGLKRDIEKVRADLQRDIETVRADLQRDIETVRADLQRDLKELDTKMETRLKELDTKMETRLKELELRMVIKMGALILGGIGLLFGLMRAWPLPVQFVPTQEMRYTVPPSLPGK
ncbi:MAG: hypothetical protein HQL73_13575 [Magnetococcales bacterium]|nr:hypothetical protein [Magnetococcales bacterium]